MIFGPGFFGERLNPELERQISLAIKAHAMGIKQDPHHNVDWGEIERMTKDPKLLDEWWEREAAHWVGN